MDGENLVKEILEVVKYETRLSIVEHTLNTTIPDMKDKINDLHKASANGAFKKMSAYQFWTIIVTIVLGFSGLFVTLLQILNNTPK